MTIATQRGRAGGAYRAAATSGSCAPPPADRPWSQPRRGGGRRDRGSTSGDRGACQRLAVACPRGGADARAPADARGPQVWVQVLEATPRPWLP